MPLITSTFKTSFFLKNGHVQTLIPALFRRTDVSMYQRERIGTIDDDFLDLDWIETGSEKLVIICHGLEGSSHSTSVAGMAGFLSKNGFDVLVMNFRSCSGEINRQLRFYHSGETGDLGQVIRHAMSKEKYKSIHLAGFSLGANVVLKYIGENGDMILPVLKKAVLFSVPCDLESSALYMKRLGARIYLNNFLKSLKAKIILKNKIRPGEISIKGISDINNFHAFDDRYTGPIHGFKDAHDYYTRSSSKQFLKDIRIPTLIVNARNDPFLPALCYPESVARESQWVYLEIPESGGHVGFLNVGLKKHFWTEKRALIFFNE